MSAEPYTKKQLLAEIEKVEPGSTTTYSTIPDILRNAAISLFLDGKDNPVIRQALTDLHRDGRFRYAR